MIRRIRVGANGHRYEIDQKKAIGVTTALGLAIAKPGLMGWAGWCAAEEAVDILEGPNPRQWEIEHNITNKRELLRYLSRAHERRRNAAAVRGTRIHTYAEELAKGEAVDVPEDLAPYVENCARFFDEWRVAPLLKEKVVGHRRLGYAGTFDLVGELPDGRRVLFDYKTGKGIHPETRLQLAAYRWADVYVAEPGLEISMKEVGITDAKVVWLRSDGYDVIPMPSGLEELAAFKAVVGVARAIQSWSDWKPEAEKCPQ